MELLSFSKKFIEEYGIQTFLEYLQGNDEHTLNDEFYSKINPKIIYRKYNNVTINYDDMLNKYKIKEIDIHEEIRKNKFDIYTDSIGTIDNLILKYRWGNSQEHRYINYYRDTSSYIDIFIEIDTLNDTIVCDNFNVVFSTYYGEENIPNVSYITHFNIHGNQIINGSLLVHRLKKEHYHVIRLPKNFNKEIVPIIMYDSIVFPDRETNLLDSSRKIVSKNWIIDGNNIITSTNDKYLNCSSGIEKYIIIPLDSMYIFYPFQFYHEISNIRFIFKNNYLSPIVELFVDGKKITQISSVYYGTIPLYLFRRVSFHIEHIEECMKTFEIIFNYTIFDEHLLDDKIRNMVGIEIFPNMIYTEKKMSKVINYHDK